MQIHNTWNLIRGQEFDSLVSRVSKADSVQERVVGRISDQYQKNREFFQTDADYPTPKTFQEAVYWLKDNEDADNYMLTVEVFDPHEPFDAAQEFKDMYPDKFGGIYNWPRYGWINEEETEEAIEHLRNQYAATLTMADKWLGKLLDEMDRQNLWKDTMVILTSDHGHMLGEHGVTGKNLFPAWNEMCRIPLLVHLPEDLNAGMRIKSLTQNIDVLPTVVDFFGISMRTEEKAVIRGKSWLPLLKKEADKIRDYCIYGWFGLPVNLADETYTYFRAPATKENVPLYSYMSVMTRYDTYMGRDLLPGELDMGRFLSWTDMPVYRMDMSSEYPCEHETMRCNWIFDYVHDEKQQYPIEDERLEEQLKKKMIAAMKEHDAPREQFDRLGLV